jgi:hypothetical protein
MVLGAIVNRRDNHGEIVTVVDNLWQGSCARGGAGGARSGGRRGARAALT